MLILKILNISIRVWSRYKLYYNNSKTNESDGVVVYLQDNLKEASETLEFWNLRVLNTTRKEHKGYIAISVIYGSICLRWNSYKIWNYFLEILTLKLIALDRRLHCYFGHFYQSFSRVYNFSRTKSNWKRKRVEKNFAKFCHYNLLLKCDKIKQSYSYKEVNLQYKLLYCKFNG